MSVGSFKFLPVLEQAIKERGIPTMMISMMLELSSKWRLPRVQKISA